MVHKSFPDPVTCRKLMYGNCFFIKQLRDMIYYQENIEYNQIFHGLLILWSNIFLDDAMSSVRVSSV